MFQLSPPHTFLGLTPSAVSDSIWGNGPSTGKYLTKFAPEVVLMMTLFQGLGSQGSGG